MVSKTKPYYHQRKLPLIITKSNELVRAQLRVENNSLANKIFYLLVRAVGTGSFPKVSVPVKDISTDRRLAGPQYKAIEAAASVLLKASVHTIIADPKDSEILLGFRKSNIFTDIDYEKGTITAKFNASMKPHLVELKKRFTTLNYFELMDMQSFYSQRIYEIIKSWEKPEGFVELDLEAFYDMISFPKEMREDFSFVRRKALEKAEKDINTRTELKFCWEAIKEGRKVVAIRFAIGEQGSRTQKKRQTKEAEKERQEGHEAAARRKPHLEAARQCRIDHGMRAGDTCKLARPRSKKCKLCAQTAGITYYNQDSLFDI